MWAEPGSCTHNQPPAPVGVPDAPTYPFLVQMLRRPISPQRPCLGGRTSCNSCCVHGLFMCSACVLASAALTHLQGGPVGSGWGTAFTSTLLHVCSVCGPSWHWCRAGPLGASGAGTSRTRLGPREPALCHQVAHGHEPWVPSDSWAMAMLADWSVCFPCPKGVWVPDPVHGHGLA